MLKNQILESIINTWIRAGDRYRKAVCYLWINTPLVCPQFNPQCCHTGYQQGIQMDYRAYDVSILTRLE